MSKQVLAFPCADSTWKCRNLTIVNGTNANYTNFYTKINITSITFSNTNELQIFNDSCNNVSYVSAQARDILSNTTTSIRTGFETNYINNTGVSNVWSACYNYTGAGSPPSTTDAGLVVGSAWVNTSLIALKYNTSKSYGTGYDVWYKPYSNSTYVGQGHSSNFGIGGHQILNWIETGTQVSSKNFTQMDNFTVNITNKTNLNYFNTSSICEAYANSNCVLCNDTIVVKTTGGTNAFIFALGYNATTYKSDLTFAYRNGTGVMKEVSANAADATYEWDGKMYQVYNESGSWAQIMMLFNANYNIANWVIYGGYTGYFSNQIVGLYPNNYTAGNTYTHTRVYCLNAGNWTLTDQDTEYLKWSLPLSITVGAEQTSGGGGDTCTYTQGDWNINIADKCNLTSGVNVTGNVFIYGNGTTGYTLLSHLNFTKFYVFGNATGIIAVKKGSVFKAWK